MRATRHRLRFVTGVSISAATYGSGQYGSTTYGQQATDPVAALRHWLVPWPSGYPTDPSWIYRQGDTAPPFRAQVRNENGVADLVGIALAHLVLLDTDNPTGVDRWLFELTVTTIDGTAWLTRTWTSNDLDVPGSFRAAVVLTYTSGRRLTVPADDRHHFMVTPISTIPVPPQPAYRWDEARWDYALWQ